MTNRYWFPLLAAISVLLLGVASAQQPAPAAPPASSGPGAGNQDFLALADRVMADISKLLSLEVKRPLKKSLRSREEIRAYLVKQLEEDEEPAKRYADSRVLEKFGLIPKGFDLEAFLVELLTEQIAGLYDPKGNEFFIADWNKPEEQETVMAHEMVHALHDQHFEIEKWVDAAKPNDDAVFARTAVVEGSALAAMLDYLFRDAGVSVRTLPDIGPLMQQFDLASGSDSPQLKKAPVYIRDSLMFPYLRGAAFTQAVLRSVSGWAEFHSVFAKPPASTQQILHPEMYFSNYVPEPVSLPDLPKLVPKGWKLLDENVMGEFGLHAVLKQHLGEDRARELSPAWDGDRYAILEHENTKQTLLVFLLRLGSEAAAARFFGQYSEALELKYAKKDNLLRRPNFFSFGTAEEGEVFLYCLGSQCLSTEGAARATFDRIVRALGWPAAPRPAVRAAPRSIATAAAPYFLAPVRSAAQPHL
jgi:hypothetical protein